MLLDVICRRNPSLVEAAIALRRQDRIPANSYVVDLDAVRANARHLRAAGNRHGLSVFAHDQDGTRVTYRGGMRVGNVGHLVQILRAEADAAAALEPECWTVFSDEKAAEAVAAARRGRTQALLGRIQAPAPGDLFYNGHEGGFYAHAIAVVWSAMALAIGHFVFRQTRFGAHVLAIGDSQSAARGAGIKVDRVRVAVLVISASSAAVAGLLYAGRLQGARYTLGEADVMTVIAAVIVGGTRLTGGSGSVPGALVGSLLMGMLNNGLILMGLSVSEQMIVRCCIILLAVAISLRQKLT